MSLTDELHKAYHGGGACVNQRCVWYVMAADAVSEHDRKHFMQELTWQTEAEENYQVIQRVTALVEEMEGAVDYPLDEVEEAHMRTLSKCAQRLREALSGKSTK